MFKLQMVLEKFVEMPVYNIIWAVEAIEIDSVNSKLNVHSNK